MNRPLGRRSFGSRISWLVTVTSAVAILAVSLVLATFNHLEMRGSALAALEAQSSTIALNSGAPLVFGDRGNASEVLSALRAMPAVTSATLYGLDGRRFARYTRGGDSLPDDAPLPDGLNARGDEVVAVTPVREKGQLLGRLHVTYDARPLRRQLWQSLAVVGLVALVAITLVFLLARQATRVVIAPVEGLARTARRVSRTKDYSLRASKGADDEIGAFTDTFNEMLAQIQRQDVDIKASRAEAEAASRMKDEFLATLSHELRTPMTPILGWAQILRRLAEGNPQVLQAADVIERNAVTQTRIIDDLLEMSRIVSGKIRLDIQEFDIGDVVRAAIEVVRGAAQARGITLALDVAPGMPRITGDPHRIQQVLWNLLSNAVKFTGEGGRVLVAASCVEGVLQLSVADNGKGIAPEFLPHVFERFRQADSSVTRQHGGLGLGLAIVEQIVALHGGTIEASSTGLGRGATFTVSLPGRCAGEATAQPTGIASPEPREPRVRDPGSDGLPLQGLRLLVVDDEEDARVLVARVLADSGAEVVSVASAAAALAALRQGVPDLLVSDIGMPGADGYWLIGAIRALPAESGGTLPAIALSAFARPDDRARALNAGFHMHVGKPIDQSELVAGIASLLRLTAAPRAMG